MWSVTDDAVTVTATRHVEFQVLPAGTDLGTQGLGRGLRLWFSDMFTPEMAANHKADRVIAQFGYRHPDGWFGPVAISMESDDSGTTLPLLRGLPAIIDLHARGPRPHGRVSA